MKKLKLKKLFMVISFLTISYFNAPIGIARGIEDQYIDRLNSINNSLKMQHLELLSIYQNLRSLVLRDKILKLGSEVMFLLKLRWKNKNWSKNSIVLKQK